MLKIPGPGDRPGALVVPPKILPEELLRGTSAERKGNKRRRKRKSRHSDGNAWDRSEEVVAAAGGGEKRQMVWMLVGGAALFALILGGVLVIFLGGEQRPSVVGERVAAEKPVVVPEATSQRSDAEFLAEAMPLAKRFLEARRVEDLLPLVRNASTAEPRIRGSHPDGTIDAPGMAGGQFQNAVVRQGKAISLMVRTGDYEERALVFFETGEGLKIDWESWAGWSEMPWDEFLGKRAGEEKVFRLYLSPVEYYNFGFSDDQKWQSYRLESPDGEHAVYGYVERDSELASRLRPPPDSKRVAMMLSLKFPEDAKSGDQLIICSMAGEGWVFETGEKP